MGERLDERVNGLSESGITVTVLEALDFVVPGEWSNTTSFFQLIGQTTGETAPQVLAQIHEKALALESNDTKYSRALWVFETIDTIDKVAAGAALAGKVTDLFGGLDFLKKFTPKPETTQALDAGLKLVAELVAFGMLRGWPEMNFDGIARFVIGLQDYARYDLMRIASWVVLDGILPLGPDFIQKIVATTSDLAADHLSDNQIFKGISDKLPGDNVSEKRDFIVKAIDATGEWVGGFVAEKGLTESLIKGKMSGALSIVDGGGDYLAAALDASTDYFTHTGTQTVARVLIQDAYKAIKDDVWAAHVARVTSM